MCAQKTGSTAVSPLLPRHQGLPPQRSPRLIRLGDSRCRKRPCCSRAHRCRSGRGGCCWPGHRWSCRFDCHLLCSWLLGGDLLRCRFLRRYRFLGCRFFGCDLLLCRFLRRYRFLGCRFFGGDLLRCRFFRRYRFFSCWFLSCRSLLCCWFSFLCFCHFYSPCMNES